MPSIADVEYQPQVTALNDNGLQALQDLGREKLSHKKLQERLRQASELLTEVVGSLNDRAVEEKVRYGKKRARLQANGQEEDSEELASYDTFQDRVTTLTKEMDISMRGLVDNQIWMKDLPQVIRGLNPRPEVAASQPTQRTRPTPTQSTMQDGSHDIHPDDEMDIDQAQDRQQKPPLPFETPSALLQTALIDHESNWNAKSLTEKYSHNNDYIGFYRVVYDAKNPGENVPPIPHPSLWFASEETQDAGSTPGDMRGEADDNEDSDLEVASEKTRIKCPITLLTFKDPVISDLCQHSYERSAILDMLKTSPEAAPWTEEQLVELSQLSGRERTRREQRIRTPQVKCPECNVSLTEANLKPNPVLLRKVKRILEAQRRRDVVSSDEEGDGDLDGIAVMPSGSQRMPMGLESSPAEHRTSRAATREVKPEKAGSVVPQTQFSNDRQSATPVRSTRSQR